jgi:O-antigen/teichoic acid export membrane protein
MTQIQSQTTAKIFSNTFYQLVGKVFSMLITVGATVLIARTYGREGYGAFNLMQTWPAFMYIIVDFGLNAIATREIAKDWSKAEKYFGTVLIVRILLSLVFMGVLWGLLQFFPYSPELRQGIRINLLLILTQALFATTNIVFQPKLRYDLSVMGNMTGYIFILAAVYWLCRQHAPVYMVSFSYVIGGFITFFVNLTLIKKLGIAVRVALDLPLLKFLLIRSLPLGLMFVFSQLNFKSDSLLMSFLPLPKFLGLNNTESVAVYGLPYKIFEVGLVLPTFIMNAAYPVFVRHMIEGKQRLGETFRKVISTLIGLGFLCGALGIIFSPLAIKLIGGAQFSQSVILLQILLGGLVIYFTTQPLAWLIVTLDGQKYLPWVYLISAVFNITANYIFIPVYSFYASSIITHLSELLILVLLVITARHVWKEKYA